MVTQLQHNFMNALDRKFYETQKASLFKEINSNKIIQPNFKKTVEERIQIWEMQQSYKKAMLKCYPDPKVRKQMNNPLMECE